MERLSENDQVVDKISQELISYKMAQGIFGMKQTIRQRNQVPPGK